MRMHHADTKRDCLDGGGNVLLLAEDLDGTLFLLVKAVEDVHQRSLACAVLTQKAVDRSFSQLKINGIIGFYIAEDFGDSLHFDS